MQWILLTGRLEACPTCMTRIQIVSTALDFSIEHFATGWQGALTRSLKIEAESTPLVIAAPQVVSLKLPRTLPKVVSFTFPEAAHWGTVSAPAKQASAPQRDAVIDEAKQRERRLTRIKPP